MSPESIAQLHPTALWKHFHQLSGIPRPSRHEQGVRDYLQVFAASHGLEELVDEVGNVIIRKPATPGMEESIPVVLQGHMDMVPQANAGSRHVFTRDPISTRIEGEWVIAEGTTLGADNGIGMAAMLGVLASVDLTHGPLEALFTCNEEDGMDGAFGLRPGLLRAGILINTDSEDEGVLCIGCAGGANVSSRFEYREEPVTGDWSLFNLSVTGLKGGHSGVDIHRGRGNAVLLLFRILKQAMNEQDLRIAALDAGNMRNAIPREGFAQVGVPTVQREGFVQALAGWESTLTAELGGVEPDLRVRVDPLNGVPAGWIEEGVQQRLTHAIAACPSGVVRMSDGMPGLVETSTNLSIVRSEKGVIEVHSLVRSSVDSAREAVCGGLVSLFELAGAATEIDGQYPGWKPDVQSPILGLVREAYLQRFGEPAEIGAIHAGLECGILSGNYPEMDMISFGPTIRFPHSPDERVRIPSVERFWLLLVDVLSRIPGKCSDQIRR